MKIIFNKILFLKKQKTNIQKINVKFTKEFNTKEKIIIYKCKINKNKRKKVGRYLLSEKIQKI